MVAHPCGLGVLLLCVMTIAVMGSLDASTGTVGHVHDVSNIRAFYDGKAGNADGHTVSRSVSNNLDDAEAALASIPKDMRHLSHAADAAKAANKRSHDAVSGLQDDMDKAYATVAGYNSVAAWRKAKALKTKMKANKPKSIYPKNAKMKKPKSKGKKKVQSMSEKSTNAFMKTAMAISGDEATPKAGLKYGSRRLDHILTKRAAKETKYVKYSLKSPESEIADMKTQKIIKGFGALNEALHPHIPGGLNQPESAPTKQRYEDGAAAAMGGKPLGKPAGKSKTASSLDMLP